MLKRTLSPSHIHYSDKLMQQKLQILGLKLNTDTGHLYYSDIFTPLTLDFELVFVRHGETYGNCGQATSKGKIDFDAVQEDERDTNKRVFQGDVDSAINQLTTRGKAQALAVAQQLEKDLLANDWLPDTIFYSPLTRAKDTGLPFVIRNNLQNRYTCHPGIKEMSFGSWDNRRVCDLTSEDECHTFYRNQHALVKNSGINGNGVQATGESFCDVLLRAYQVLQELNRTHSKRKVLMFSHSMFGAACCILLGKGQVIENGTYLAFDGIRNNNEPYIMPHTTPFLMNFKLK